MQVLHYENGGQFVLHHDGFDRILTVICYLNGVGETWLPLVDVKHNRQEGEKNEMHERLESGHGEKDEGNEHKNKCQEGCSSREDLNSLDEAIREVEENNMLPGSDGVLLSGSKTVPTNCNDNYTAEDDDDDGNQQSHIISVSPGDAVAFYNYANHDKNGQKDWRSIHAGLPVEHTGDEGKWLATCWFHAPSLVSREMS